MLLVLAGENRIEVLAELERDMAKRGLTHTARFSEDIFSSDDVLASVEQQDMFSEGEKAVVLDKFASFTEGKEFLEKEASRLASSSRAVYVLESSLSATFQKLLSKAGAEVSSVGITEKRKNSTSIFALSDALATRDKKTLWILYQDISRVAEPEEIAGVLVWQLKAMWLVSIGETGSLNPYVVSKTHGALRNYKPEEIHKLLFEIVKGYHQAHRGGENLSLFLERFVLLL